MRVIVIMSDTFRYDHLGFLGHKPVNTPGLDAFSREAVVFHNHYLGSFPTIPCRDDLLTGQYGFPFHGWSPLRKEAVTLPESLKRGEVVSQLIGDTPHIFRLGYNRGFNGNFWVRGQEGDTYMTRMNYPIKIQMPHAKTRTHAAQFGHTLADLQRWVNMRQWTHEEDMLCAATTRVVCEWLEDNYKHDNMFLWVDLFDPHEPWDVPEYMWRKYDPDYRGDEMFHPNYGPADHYTPEELHNLWAHYAAEVDLTDKHIERILRHIKDVGIWEDSAVVFLSDHGMYIGEHGMTGKEFLPPHDWRGNWQFYEELSHTPLMIKPPGGRKIESTRALAQPVDLYPTILDWFGVEKPEFLHGRSLAPILEGGLQDEPRKAVFSTECMFWRERDLAMPMWTAVNDGEWTLIFGGKDHEPNELYHTAKDREQKQNLFGENRDQADALFGEYRQFLESVGANDQRKAFYAERFRK